MPRIGKSLETESRLAITYVGEEDVGGIGKLWLKGMKCIF